MKLKKANDRKKTSIIILSIVLAIILIIPMLYASIYLGSIWDVYSKLDNVPVAFVNQDKPFTKDGKEYAVGKEVEKNLKSNKKVGWKFVSLKDAMDGVRGTKYYAVVEIPKNFSKNMASAMDGEIKKPEIIYKANRGRNFIFSQISSTVANKLKTTVSSSIQKEISKALVDSLFDVKGSIKQAGEGVSKLNDGTEKLLDGSKKLSTGASKAANGSIKLESGLKLAADASGKLKNGTQKLLNGSNALSNGLRIAAGGSKQLQKGMKNISNGQSKIVNGSSALISGLKLLKTNLTKPNDQVSALVNGASTISKKTEAIAQGAGQMDTSISALTDGIKQADSVLHEELEAISSSNLSQKDKIKLAASIAALDKISSAKTSDGEALLIKAANALHQLSGNLEQLKGGTLQVSNGVSGLAVGLVVTKAKAAIGLDQLIGGAQGIQNGSRKILTGLNTVTDKTGQLANGLKALSNGSISLRNGLKAVNNGNMSLENGLNNAAEKMGEFSEGLKALSSGSSSLSGGLDAANKGVAKLKGGLNTGYDKMNNKLKFNSDNMSKFISEPITLKDNSINDVKLYGEGLAPYFISLSLWIGVMIISMVLTTIKSKKVFNGEFMNSYLGEFILGSTLVILQGLILSITLIKCVGVDPVDVPVFYLTNIGFSIVFFSIFYGVSEVIGALTAPVMFIVLLLQLASSGGTFPIEATPVFYRIINKIIPMTYSVSTLRMTISGINQSILNHNIVVMLIFMATFLGGGYLIRTAINLGKKKESSSMEKAA